MFVSESLTPYKKRLFANVNKLRKRMKWKYISTNNARIYIKEGENAEDAVNIIDTEEDLMNFQNRHCR
jgi:hypothetical protein